MKLSSTDLITNNDGSVYHLCLKPGEVADTILSVGDPARVGMLRRHLDVIHTTRENREFVSCTGEKNGKSITIISTGIGYGGVEIMMNEIDLLHNADFQERIYRLNNRKKLTFIRLGTSGSISRDIGLGAFVLSTVALGLPDLNAFLEFEHHTYKGHLSYPDPELLQQFQADRGFVDGLTLTLPGFYLPQGRPSGGKTAGHIMQHLLRLKHQDKAFNHIEMETAAIYALAHYLGHDSLSVSAILADRLNARFHPQPQACVEAMIEKVFDVICPGDAD